MVTPFSPLTFDVSLDNILENASIVKQPLGNEAYGVHRPGFEPINYVETLRSVYSLWNLPVTITYTAKYKKSTNSKSISAFTLLKKKVEWVFAK